MIVDQFFAEKLGTSPCRLSTIDLSPSLQLSIELSPYSDFEKNNCTNPDTLGEKIILRYIFPQLKKDQIVVPPSLKRKKVEFRSSVLQNIIDYSYVRLDLKTFLTFCKEFHE